MSPDEDLPPMPSAKFAVPPQNNIQNNHVQNNARFIIPPQQPQVKQQAAPALEHAYNARFNMQRDPAPSVNTGEGTGVAEAMWSRNTQFNQKPAMPGYVS